MVTERLNISINIGKHSFLCSPLALYFKLHYSTALQNIICRWLQVTRPPMPETLLEGIAFLKGDSRVCALCPSLGFVNESSQDSHFLEQHVLKFEKMTRPDRRDEFKNEGNWDGVVPMPLGNGAVVKEGRCLQGWRRCGWPA